MSPERVTYRNGESFLHRLHPLTKGAWLLFGTMLVFAIRSPTVAAGSERLRITLSASHEKSDIDALLDALANSFTDTGVSI